MTIKAREKGEQEIWQKIKAKGKKRYLLEGGLIWGGGMALAWALLGQAAQGVSLANFSPRGFFTSLVIGLAVFGPGMAIQAFFIWRRNERKFKS